MSSVTSSVPSTTTEPTRRERILDLVQGAGPSGQTIEQVALALGVEKMVIYGLMRTMVAQGQLRRTDTKPYTFFNPKAEVEPTPIKRRLSVTAPSRTLPKESEGTSVEVRLRFLGVFCETLANKVGDGTFRPEDAQAFLREELVFQAERLTHRA